MKKFLLLPMLALLLIFTSCLEKIEPKIDGLKINRNADNLNFEITWSGVVGGIEQAEIITYVYYKEGGIDKAGKYKINYKDERSYSISSLGGDQTSGILKFTANIEKTSMENAKEATFAVYIKDRNGILSESKTLTVKLVEERALGEPSIQDFRITQAGPRINFLITYSNVSGGIEKAKLLIQIGYTLRGERYLLEPYQVDYRKEDDYKIITSYDDNTSGVIRITSKTTAKNIKDVSDVEYRIVIVDKNGKFSQPKTAIVNFSDFTDI